MSRLKAANNAQTTLTALMEAGATSCAVANGDILPAVPFMLSIDNEIMEVGAKSGNELSSILRGQEGTVAAAHQPGSIVENKMTAGMYNELLGPGESGVKNNYSATTNPGANNDSSQGYSVGSTWINVTDDIAYICLDATVSAAKWEQTSGVIALLETHQAEEATESEYGHVRLSDLPKGKRVARFVIGTSTAGWTAADCDYLCDGTADQTEINAAITALPATGGEVVILDGTYNITDEIIVSRNNTLIRGNGNSTILKRGFDKSMSGVIRIDSKSGCKIESLLIDGDKTVYTGRHNYGIYLQSANKTTVTLCNLSLSREGGIYVNDGSCISITNNIFDGNTVYAILLESSTKNTIENNIVIEWGKIKLDASNNNIINGNWVGDESANTMKIDLTDSNYNLITGNNCENGVTGIKLYNSSSNTIIGNSCFRGMGTPEDYGSNIYTINVQSSSNDNLISSNNCKGKAVNVTSSTGNTLVNNKFDAT